MRYSWNRIRFIIKSQFLFKFAGGNKMDDHRLRLGFMLG